MAGYRWTVRDVDVSLVRRLRVLALLRGVPIARLVDEAIAQYLEREEDRRKEQPTR
jgi:predicted transcriptional regulator